MRPYSIMTLSFHSRLLRGETTVAELFGGLAQVGIEGVEPATSLFTDRPDLEAEVPRVAADLGLVMPAYDALGNLVHPEPTARAAVIDGLKRDLDRCYRWGIPVAMVAGSRVHPELGPSESRRLVAEGMNALVDTANAAGVTLAIESYGVDLELHASSAQLAEVIGMCDPTILTTFDMGNFVLGGDVPSEALDAWLARLAHVHVKDFRRLPDGDSGGLPSRDGHRYAGCRLGEGAVDVTSVVRKLAKAGYPGALSLEMGGADGLDQVAADLAVLRRAAEG